MNKYDDYIREFLISNKEVSLNKIGTLSLISPEFKSKRLHPDNVRYEFNRNVSTTPDLIDLAAQKLAKNKMLVASDFESYLQQIVQFLNIGKAHTFPGVCSIKKNKQGVYEMVSEQSIASTDTLDVSNSEVLQKSKSDVPSGSSSVRVFALLICLLILGGLIWGGYQYFSNQKNASTTTITSTDTSLNALDTTNALIDSSASTDTATKNIQPTLGATDVGQFRFIYEETVSRLRANTRTAQLKSYGYDARFDSINNNSAVKRYEMYVRRSVTPNDTALIKDSLQKFFQRTITIKQE